MSLKGEAKKAILESLKKDGMPPIIDKTYNSIWDTFAKTQPSVLSSQASSTGQLTDSDVWGNFQKSMEKYGVDSKYATRAITTLKKKFGETPSQADIKAMMQ